MNLEETVSTIVRQVVNELLQKKGKSIASTILKKIVIVIEDDRHAAEMKQLIDDISAYSRPIVAFCGDGSIPEFAKELSHTHEIIRLASYDRSGWEEAVHQADIVVLPIFSIGTLVKISRLIDDEPASGTIVHALINSKDIVVSSNFVLPTGAQKLSVPPAVLDVVSSHLQQLNVYGIHVVYINHLVGKLKALYTSTRSSKRPLIHSKHVRDWVNEGETQISLPPHVLLTPLAKEEAKLLGLEWSKSPSAKEE